MSPRKPTAKPAVTSSEEPQPSSLLEGTYDEASSAKSFQEALAEWRNGKNAESAANTSAMKGRESCTVFLIFIPCDNYDIG